MFHLCSIKTSFFVCNAFAFHVVILDGICGIFRRTGDVGIGNSLWQCLTCRACIGIAGSLKIVGFDILSVFIHLVASIAVEKIAVLVNAVAVPVDQVSISVYKIARFHRSGY